MRLACLLLLFGSVASAQVRPEDGATEVQVWSAGGHSVSGGRGNTGIWNAGLRYGWVLTEPHGPGFLVGRFEYTIEAVPAYLIFQPANTAYGAGLNPLNLKWNFATRGTLVPYLELSGGTLFTTHSVPPGTSSVNFTPQATLGFNLFTRQDRAISFDLHYEHISNAGLASPNPGFNTVQGRVGYHWFK